MKRITRNQKPGTAFNQRGAAFVLAIFTIVILTILVVGLTQVVRVELIAARANLDRTQAYYVAKAGFNLARSVLMYDDEANVDSLQDKWAKLAQEPPLQIGDGTCTVTVIDACSLININTAPGDILTIITENPDLAQTILTWREENGPFNSLGELLQIEGVTKEWLAEHAKLLTVESREPNVTADGKKRLNMNAATAQDLTQRLGIPESNANQIIGFRQSLPDQKFRSFRQLRRAGMSRETILQHADQITFTGDAYVSGRININTAPREVLELLPGVTPEFIEAILERRNQEGGEFTSLSEIQNIPGLSGRGIIPLLGLVCTKSATYIIEATSEFEYKPVQVTLQGTVLRKEGPTAPVIHGWRELPQPMFATEEEG